MEVKSIVNQDIERLLKYFHYENTYNMATFEIGRAMCNKLLDFQIFVNMVFQELENQNIVLIKQSMFNLQKCRITSAVHAEKMLTSVLDNLETVDGYVMLQNLYNVSRGLGQWTHYIRKEFYQSLEKIKMEKGYIDRGV